MATPAKRWPTNAEWARMDAMCAGEKSVAALSPILDGNMSWQEVYRRVGQALNESNRVVITLRDVGPRAGERTEKALSV